jgi:hypothetical protein
MILIRAFAVVYVAALARRYMRVLVREVAAIATEILRAAWT